MVALLVNVSLIANTMQPASAGLSIDQPIREQSELSDASHRLQSILETCKAWSLMPDSASIDVGAQIHDWKRSVADIDRQVMASFEDERELLSGMDVAPEMLVRLADMQSAYVKKIDALKTVLNSPIRNNSLDVADQIIGLFEGETSPKVDGVAPNRVFDQFTVPIQADLTHGEAIGSPVSWDSWVDLYGVVGDGSKGVGFENQDYLAETPEVVLNQVINEFAAELGNDPVRIQEWVKNNIEWIPTWGATQRADVTLSSRRGNAFDIASLTIALLRASNIPARYVHGVVQVPVDEFTSWVGGFSNPLSAWDFVSAGGIPSAGVYSAGQVVGVRVEHIWVEAGLDYEPSRSHGPGAADTWVPVDPSYKTHEVLSGLDAYSIAGVDIDSRLEALVESGTLNSDEGWISGFDQSVFTGTQSELEGALETYIEDELTDPTVGDISGGRPISEVVFSALPSTLENRITNEFARYSEIPEALSQKMTVAFGRTLDGFPVNPIDLRWSAINNQNVYISFRPAAQADENTLRSLVRNDGSSLTDFPAFVSSIIRVVPELNVGDEVVLTGSPRSLGEDINLAFDTSFVGRNVIRRSYPLPAGSFVALAGEAGGIAPDYVGQLEAKLGDYEQAVANAGSDFVGFGRKEFFGDLFHLLKLSYFGQYVSLSNLLGREYGGRHELAAGLGTLGFEPGVDTFFGIPRGIRQGGISLNIPIARVVGVDSSAAGSVPLAFQIGMLSSALEHSVPEQMFGEMMPGVEGISSAKILSKALAAGQRIYTVTADNVSQVGPMLSTDADTRQEIVSAANSGFISIVHESPVSQDGWTGTGYLVLDPVSGDGSYKISGGANGGWFIIFVFLLIAVLLFVNLFTGNFLAAFFTFLAFRAFAMRVEIIANMDISDEEKYEEVKFAAFLALLSAVLSVVRISPTQYPNEFSLKLFLSGFISIFGFAWYS